MQCSCQRRDNPVASTSTSRKSTSSRPYQQIVFDSKTTGNTRLEWISSTTTTHTSPDKTKSRVRSHVMQRFRAQQALGQHAPPSNRAGVFADYDPRIEYYFTCRMCGRLNTEGCRETTTERDVEGHLREFTMRLPIDYTSESGQLYEYLAQVYVFIQNPVRRTGLGLVQYCLPFIISSAAVLSALLSLVATHRILISGGSNSRHDSDLMAAYYHHKVQAIQIVNQSLARDLNAVAYDVQVAIAVLAIIEYTTGTIENARNHMSGLREIMAANGGTVGAPADHHLSFGIVKLANKLVSNGHQDYPSNHESRTLDYILTNLPRDSHPSIRSMFHSLKHLATTMPQAPSGNMTQQSAWLDQLNITELKMHRILENDYSPRHPSSSFVTWRAYPIAGSIFLCLWLRQLSLRSNVLDYLVVSLKYALEETIEDQYPLPVYLWLLFVGGAAAEGRRYRPWFLATLSRTLQRLKLDSWQRVNGVLVVFPYVEECDGYFRRIWEELQTEED
ncbi:hypothetical protein EYB25_005120 [Talaromyces marneffei]|uniref:Uncharacterized protein n=1 Tax=Talaromyces marneffei PM1 TaxID=1077442 RepID=A0A093VMN5_TALMA|nr:uncharacterized protein EYB26_003830 [Talaromyces marneffei]KAE8553738.1 hypothetical protein EYB25_005120 [Talaromyces marneffei]QGA16163.1 hypothetical protein EYB26_003830 [Talaromyces marneffei]